MFGDMPSINFDDEEKGWKSIFLGILSPYGNKYHSYVEQAIKKAKDEQIQSLITDQQSNGDKTDTQGNVRRAVTNNYAGNPTGAQTVKQSQSQPLIKNFSQVQAQAKQASQQRKIVDEKKSTFNLHKSNSQKNMIDNCQNVQFDHDLYKLSEFQKFKIANEIINGRITSNSAQYLGQVFKKDGKDYMKQLYKKVLFRKALKNNFEEPYMINGKKKLEVKSQEEVLSPSKTKSSFSGKTIEAIQGIQKKVQRAGLDAIAPHFIVDLERFTYLDFEVIDSEKISALLNEMHQIKKVKREKYRNSKSMIDIKMMVEDDDKEDDLDENENKERAQEKKNFIDAHYLNRRKSCQCTHCGGFDNQHIRKMDKTAMDQLKLGISHLLKQKIQTNTNLLLRRMKMGKIDENDDVIAKPSVVKRKPKINLPKILKDSPLLKPIFNLKKNLNIYDSLKKIKAGRPSALTKIKSNEDLATIITIDELNKFNGEMSLPVILEPQTHPADVNTYVSNMNLNAQFQKDVAVSNFLSRMAQHGAIEDAAQGKEASDHEDSDIIISIETSSLKTSFDSKDEEENERKRLEFIAQKNQIYNRTKTAGEPSNIQLNVFSDFENKIIQERRLSNQEHIHKKALDKMRLMLKSRDNFKIREYKQLSQTNPNVHTYNDKDIENHPKNKKQFQTSNPFKERRMSKEQIASLFKKCQHRIFKQEVKEEVQKIVVTGNVQKEQIKKIYAKNRIIFSASPQQNRRVSHQLIQPEKSRKSVEIRNKDLKEIIIHRPQILKPFDHSNLSTSHQNRVTTAASTHTLDQNTLSTFNYNRSNNLKNLLKNKPKPQSSVVYKNQELVKFIKKENNQNDYKTLISEDFASQSHIKGHQYNYNVHQNSEKEEIQIKPIIKRQETFLKHLARGRTKFNIPSLSVSSQSICHTNSLKSINQQPVLVNQGASSTNNLNHLQNTLKISVQNSQKPRKISFKIQDQSQKDSSQNYNNLNYQDKQEDISIQQNSLIDKSVDQTQDIQQINLYDSNKLQDNNNIQNEELESSQEGKNVFLNKSDSNIDNIESQQSQNQSH